MIIARQAWDDPSFDLGDYLRRMVDPDDLATSELVAADENDEDADEDGEVLRTTPAPFVEVWVTALDDVAVVLPPVITPEGVDPARFFPPIPTPPTAQSQSQEV